MLLFKSLLNSIAVSTFHRDQTLINHFKIQPFIFQNDALGDEIEPILEDEPCYGKRCTANEHCCPGSVCVDVDGGKFDPIYIFNSFEYVMPRRKNDGRSLAATILRNLRDLFEALMGFPCAHNRPHGLSARTNWHWCRWRISEYTLEKTTKTMNKRFANFVVNIFSICFYW